MLLCRVALAPILRYNFQPKSKSATLVTSEEHGVPKDLYVSHPSIKLRGQKT